MYRINGISMPGFGIAVVVFVILSIVGKWSFSQTAFIGISIWIAIDAIIIIERVLRKRDKNKR